MNWLLLRGLGRVSEHWFDFPNLLKTPENHVLCLDLPGVGTEKNSPVPTSIKKNYLDLRRRFLKQKSNTMPWGILGYSMGGMIALQWLHDSPEDFALGIIVNSSAKDLSPLSNRLSVFSMYCGLRAGLTSDPLQYEKNLLKMVSNNRAKDPVLIEAMSRISKISGVTPKVVLRQLIASSQFMSPSSIEIPVAFIASIKDQMVDVSCSKKLAEKYNAPIKFHPSSGHEITLDDPLWLANQIKDFQQTSHQNSIKT